MQTNIADFIRDTPKVGKPTRSRNVRHAVRTPTCPTTSVGRSSTGSAARIDLTNMRSRSAFTEKTQIHIDRCSRAMCETTGPSAGVQRPLDTARSGRDRFTRSSSSARALLRKVITVLLFFDRRKDSVRCTAHAPASIAPQKCHPARDRPSHFQRRRTRRRMLVLEGWVQRTCHCNQPAAARVRTLGISLVALQGDVAGRVFHLNARSEALDFMRRNIDEWWHC